MSSLPVSLVNPKIAPLASASQYGAPKPVRAGTTRTFDSGEPFWASASVSEEFSKKSKPSLYHCIAEPATKILPSSA